VFIGEGPALKTAEITGRKGDMQINPDGTKTMECHFRLLQNFSHDQQN
jgi:hypothetical protein